MPAFQSLKNKLTKGRSRSNSVDDEVVNESTAAPPVVAPVQPVVAPVVAPVAATTALPHETSNGVSLKDALEADLEKTRNPLTTERVLAEQTAVVQPTAAVQYSSDANTTTYQTVQRDVVVKENIHPIEKEEIQPVIFREREQLEVKQITEQLFETNVQDVVYRQQELPPQVRPAVFAGGNTQVTREIVQPSTFREETQRQQVILEPRVEETVRVVSSEELHPVIVRHVVQPTLVHQTRPIHERIVEEATVIKTVVEERHELGEFRGTKGIQTSDATVQNFVSQLHTNK